MTKMLEFFDYCMEIDDDTCNVCTSDHPEWAKDIEDQMLKEYPDDWSKRFVGLPANHRAWFRMDELWKKHHVKCLCFAYDDLSFSLCKRHLQEFSQILDEKEGAIDG